MTQSLGALVIDIEGKALSEEDKEILVHPLVGGVVLFSRNYESRQQLTDLCSRIRSVRDSSLLIMVDQEGGRVQRFIQDFTRLPAMASLGQLYDEDVARALLLAENVGWLMAEELLSAGVDLSLAPVLDLNKQMSDVIGTRAFHADHQAVVQLATAYIKGMHQAGMASTGKHFPGHGAVLVDSHWGVPIDNRTLSEIRQDDMIPFIQLIQAGITAIMPAHIIFPEVDENPVGFSSVWLQTILRKQLNFSGVIVSDDLHMEGANISENYADRVQAARMAGCDFTLLCNNRSGVIQVLDHLSERHHRVSEEKWRLLRGDFSSIEPSYQTNKRWQETHEFLLNMA